MFVRVSLLIIMLVTISGCATWERVKNATNQQVQSKEEQEAIAKEEAERKAKAAALALAKEEVLRPGSTASQFAEHWGNPMYLDYENDVYSAYYPNDGRPLFVYFKNGKIAGWKYDQASVEREKDRQQRQSIATAEQQQRQREETARAWRALGQSLQQPSTKTSCTSRTVGGTVYTNCN